MDPYQALADPVRRQIVELLARRHLPAGRVAEAFGHISRPAVSRHLRLLREAGLVNAERVGRERIFRADIEALDVIGAWIDGLRPRWDQHLDAMATEFTAPAVSGGAVKTQRRATGPAPTTEEQSA